MGFLLMMVVLALGILLIGGTMQRASGRRPVEGDSAVAAQLNRMESALTALEARVDDLQEQQRFLERLIADPPEPRTLPRGGAGAREAAGDGSPEEASAGGILFETGPSGPERASSTDHRASSTDHRASSTGDRASRDQAEER